MQDGLDAFGGDQCGGGQRGHAHPLAIVAQAQGVYLAGIALGQPGQLAGAGLGPHVELGQKEATSRGDAILQARLRRVHWGI